MNSTPIKRILIVGGGTAGWMAAAALSERYRDHDLHIQLLESDKIASVGVGEATVPGILQLHQHLNISEREFIRATGATFKLGIEFTDWYSKGESFFHPFAAFGSPIGEYDFYQCWLKLYREGFHLPLEDFCLAIAMAKQGRFAQPDDEASNPLALYNYAYHFDASRYAQFLRQYAEKRRVQRIEGKLQTVEQCNQSPQIKRVILEDGQQLEADLFVDCSGFRALLIEDCLHTGFEDWSQWLPCDRAVTMQSKNVDAPLPYTRSTALTSGWQWRIPLQHRTGNGYVYCSRFCSDEEAEESLYKHLPGEALTPPRAIPFKTGMRKQFWSNNCVALGLASGFIEPLESTSISLIQTGIEKLMQFLPDLVIDAAKVAEANRLNRLEYEGIRDFIVLHYKASTRSDSDFWRYVKTLPLPTSLSEKIRRFNQDGSIVLLEQESFQEQSWIAMYNGFKHIPERCKRQVTQLDSEQLRRIMESMRSAIASGANCAPTHSDFLTGVYA